MHHLRSLLFSDDAQVKGTLAVMAEQVSVVEDLCSDVDKVMSEAAILRAQYEAIEGAQAGPGTESYPWWKRDARIFATLPIIATFAFGLTAILTGIFLFEAFVTQLYSGPGQKLIVCFADLVNGYLISSL